MRNRHQGGRWRGERARPATHRARPARCRSARRDAFGDQAGARVFKSLSPRVPDCIADCEATRYRGRADRGPARAPALTRAASGLARTTATMLARLRLRARRGRKQRDCAGARGRGIRRAAPAASRWRRRGRQSWKSNQPRATRAGAAGEPRFLERDSDAGGLSHRISRGPRPYRQRAGILNHAARTHNDFVSRRIGALSVSRGRGCDPR